MKVKNIFKKNQIIIFALAIMIAIAGYLNFSRDKTKESDLEEAASSAVNDDLFADIDGDSYSDLPDISDEDLASSEASNDDLLVVNDPVTTEDNMVADSEDKNVVDQSSEDAKAADAEGEDVKAVDAEDAKATDGDKTEVETTAPGEAILASTTISSAYFSTAKLTREQTRAKNTERLMDIISDANTSQKLKDKASNKLMELTAIAEKESSTEILLEAKGFSGAVVSIGDDVDVIVNSTSLTDQDKAIIEDVVMRKTGVEADKIVITNVVTEE
jgi:stage III sporulation protein AH